MRVRYLLRYYPVLTETFVAREIAGVAARGHEVSVATLGTRPDGALQDELPDVPVLQVPRRPLAGRMSRPTAGMRWLARHQRPKDVARLPWLARRLAEVDHLHVHFMGEAAELGHALHLDHGVPYSVTVHAADLFRPRPSLQEVLGAASSVLTIAHHNRAVLADLGIESRVVRCGPDLRVFRPRPLPDGALRALFIGRAVSKKGLDHLLAAWPRVLELAPDARLALVSDHGGPVPAGVDALGLQRPSGVRRALERCNLVVLPCRQAADGDLDGVPVALMEALATGRPVLTTPVSGIGELVDHEVGWLVQPDDVDALVQGLTAALDPEERARRGARGPQRLRTRGFTLDAQVDGVIDAWQSPHG